MTRDWFAGRVADRYDASTADLPVEPVVGVLAELAGRGGPVLELGIGTGRIALPLAERGLRVHGIDLSPDMVARLRHKPGGAELQVAIGDFATTRLDGTFSLVYLVGNTIMNLTSQDAQVACFATVASQLDPAGRFVVEVVVPNTRRLEVFDLGDRHVGVDEYEPASQACVSHHFTLVDGRWERLSIPFRAVSPAELDLMARLAGLTLEHRWSGWERAPFTNESPSHVSVWKKP
jgi:SAM-dependent methyltransferase